jgi:hypothetical protein
MNKRRVLLITLALVTLLLVAVPSVVTANPLSEPAWKRYVDGKVAELYQYIDQKVAELYAYVDEKIAEIGGGGGPDFDVPDEEDWTIEAFVLTEGGHTENALSLGATDPEGMCSWNGAPIGVPFSSDPPAVQTRAVARYDDEVLGYAVGTCRVMHFEELSYLPEVGETIQVDIWFFWMGKEKQVTLPVVITEPPNRPPECSLSVDPELGYAPLEVTLTATTSDPDGDEIVEYRWDFGDGTTTQGSQVEVHTYTNEGGYYPLLWVVDARGGEGPCDSAVYVDPPQG